MLESLSTREACVPLAQTNTVVIVHAGRIRNDYLIAFAQAVEYFDRAHRSAAQLYLGASSFLAVRAKLEHTHGLLRLTERRPVDIENVPQSFEFNGSIDAQIGTSALRQAFGKRNVHSESAFARRRIDPGYPCAYQPRRAALLSRL